TEQRQLHQFPPSQNPGAGFSWSRDGQWIAFTQGAPSWEPDAEADIWKMRVDGSELQNLTANSPGNDSHPSFSGDGKQVVFRSGRSGSFDLYLMNADGSNVRRLTNDKANDLFPVFSPSANQVAYISNRYNPASKV